MEYYAKIQWTDGGTWTLYSHFSEEGVETQRVLITPHNIFWADLYTESGTTLEKRRFHSVEQIRKEFYPSDCSAEEITRSDFIGAWNRALMETSMS